MVLIYFCVLYEIFHRFVYIQIANVAVEIGSQILSRFLIPHSTATNSKENNEFFLLPTILRRKTRQGWNNWMWRYENLTSTL